MLPFFNIPGYEIWCRQNKKGKLCEINRGKSPFVYFGFREVIFLVLKTIYSYRFLSPDNGFPVLSLPYFVQTYGKIIEIGKGWTYKNIPSFGIVLSSKATCSFVTQSYSSFFKNNLSHSVYLLLSEVISNRSLLLVYYSTLTINNSNLVCRL